MVPSDPYADILSQWLDALEGAVSSGAIPNIPITDSIATYGDQYPSGPEIRSSIYQCRARAKSETPDAMIGPCIDNGSFGDPEANVRPDDLLKQKN